MSSANVDLKSISWFIDKLKNTKNNISTQIKNLQLSYEKVLPEWYDIKYKRLSEIIFDACEKLNNSCCKIEEAIRKLKRIKYSLLKYVDKSFEWLAKNQGTFATGAISTVIRIAMGAFFAPISFEESMLRQRLSNVIQSAIDSGVVMSEIERFMATSYLTYGANLPQFIVDENGNLIALSETED